MDAGENVNEVEAAGNTPLHCAAYEGWLEGIELLIKIGAKARLLFEIDTKSFPPQIDSDNSASSSFREAKTAI